MVAASISELVSSLILRIETHAWRGTRLISVGGGSPHKTQSIAYSGGENQTLN